MSVCLKIVTVHSVHSNSFESDKYEDGNGLSLYEKVKNLANNKTKYRDLIIDIKELIEKNKAVAYNMFNKGAGR